MIENGIKFGDRHSYFDFEFILTNAEITPPEPCTKYVEVPGRDGVLDLSEALGEIKYKLRKGSFEFVLKPNALSVDERLREFMNCVHGKNLKMILDNDPDYYYEGRCFVSSFERKGNLVKVSVEADLQPFKLKLKETVRYFELPVGESNVVCKNERMSVVPTLRAVSQAFSVEVNGEYVALQTGKNYKLEDLKFTEGENAVKVKSTQDGAKLKVVYQEGGL